MAWTLVPCEYPMSQYTPRDDSKEKNPEAAKHEEHDPSGN